MARWRLTEPHYLQVPGTKWEYSELDRITGRPKRTQFNVPLFLDPKSESDWNVRHPSGEGDIVVALEGTESQPGDIVFIGNPTPGMFPLDHEAKEISSKFSWKPTEGLDPESQNQSFSNQLLSGLIDQMTNTKVQQVNGMEDMLKAMTDMMTKQTEILGRLTESRPVGLRRP